MVQYTHVAKPRQVLARYDPPQAADEGAGQGPSNDAAPEFSSAPEGESHDEL